MDKCFLPETGDVLNSAMTFFMSPDISTNIISTEKLSRKIDSCF